LISQDQHGVSIERGSDLMEGVRIDRAAQIHAGYFANEEWMQGCYGDGHDRPQQGNAD
jgi:hypothetical protein